MYKYLWYKYRNIQVFVISSCISINRVTSSSSIHFSTITNILLSVKRFHFILVIFKVACQASPGSVRKRAGTISYIWRHILKVLKKRSFNNNVLLWTYKSWYSLTFLFQSFYRFFFCACNLHQYYLTHLADFKNLFFLK